jgi:DNA segregation ATPase FtsK/SpoIIIE, S-DNA-T family
MGLLSVEVGDRRDYGPVGLLRRPSIRVPVVVLLAWCVLRGLWQLGQLLAKHPKTTAAGVLLLSLYGEFGVAGPVLALVVVAAGLGGLLAIRRATFTRVKAWGYGQWRWAIRYRRSWPRVTTGCGLATTVPTATATGVRPLVHVPAVTRVRSWAGVDEITVRLLYGQSPQSWAAQTEALRHAVGARACSLREHPASLVTLTFAYRDPLATVVPPLPVPDVLDVTALPVGRTEDGGVWRLRLHDSHLMIAAATGAGKSGLVWALLRSLASSIRDGSTVIWAIDPKQVELAIGRELFTRYTASPDPDVLAALLEDAVLVMQHRLAALSGSVRAHTATAEAPRLVLVVDELAALSAYVADRAAQKRIQVALGLLLSQGRAAGVHVVGCVQDPRKETLPFRALFPTRVALRLVERTETDLVLRHGARDRGAVCDQIPAGLPGVGYVALEGTADLTRVRASYLTDADIVAMAADYPTPHRDYAWPAADSTSRTAEVLDNEWEAFAADYRTRNGISDD